jgi:hypothetical protein
MLPAKRSVTIRIIQAPIEQLVFGSCSHFGQCGRNCHHSRLVLGRMLTLLSDRHDDSKIFCYLGFAGYRR